MHNNVLAMKLAVDPVLVNAIVAAAEGAFSMMGIQPLAVGASRMSTARHNLSIMVGLVGRNSGGMTLNLSPAALFFIAERMTDTPHLALSEENIDALMELGNMVAGCLKEQLLSTDHRVDHISLPSMIAGQRYDVLYARGINTISVEFELAEMPVTAFADRYVSVTVSLLRAAGEGLAAA
jgi:chemotaxis protein CheX